MRGESSGNIRKRDGISEATIRRLSNYYRILEELLWEEVATISSEDLARRYGTTSAQVRKDFSSFGSFGRRGLGYRVQGLKENIAAILGIDRSWQIVLVGAGHLGHALFQYDEFHKQGFHIAAVFDINPKKIGGKWEGVIIQPMSEFTATVEKLGVKIGVIAVPPASGQSVADRMVDAGVKGILNFSPVKLGAPEQVFIRNVNLSIAMESLSYSLSKGKRLKPF